MALESEGDGGAKRRRLDDQAAGAEVDPEDRISALPDDVRRRILTRLPLKDAIRSAALSQGWRDLWKSRWAEPTSCRDIHLLPGDNLRKALGSLERGPRHRLDRFSFVSDNEKLRQPHLKRFLAYAAECHVEDLHVEVRQRLVFHLPLSSPLLAHLSLRNVDLCQMYYKGAQPFYALESMHLHSVNSTVQFSKVMALCPRLHTLDMRRCRLRHIPYGGNACTPLPLNLRRITVVECFYGADCWRRFMPAPCLCSFYYIGSFLGLLFFLPKDAVLITDLYICLSDPEPVLPKVTIVTN
jgi:hypothetical protein